MLRVRLARQSASQPDVPVLRSLGPTYVENLHGRHAAVLLKVLTDKSANAARNIALAGHYGSGKSSVIRGVQEELDKRKISWVNLSLSSLGVGDTKRARIQDDSTLAPLRALQNRMRVESVSAGGAAVTLRAKENSYFDEYLDEIVYFFQKTRTQVAIFEDLDRFGDPHIFETLRELNTVLNNSEQVKSRPVRFVYAVRDSIFEQLTIDVAPDSDADADADGRHGLGRGRLARKICKSRRWTPLTRINTLACTW